MNIGGKVIIVTGGARGLGRGIVDGLLARDAKVVVLDLDAAALLQLRAELPDVEQYACDVTCVEQVGAAVDAISAAHGAIDGLVNNAGLIHSRPLFSLMARGDRKHDLATWRRVIDANLTSVFVMTSHVVEKMVMKRTRGVIVNISSISAAGNAGQTAYSAAKAGVNALTVTWAKELGALGIRAVAIAPGFVDTASTRAAMNEGALVELKRETPLRSLGNTGNIAQAVIFALENDFVTGTVIEVDGGLRM